jgi:chromosomal replication initiator protein
LFNLFDLFHTQGKQLVFTAPQHPNTLQGLEERIVSRLEGGLVAELAEPDREVRRAALPRICAAQRIAPDAALLDYLADRPVDSVRTLTGLVQRVASAAAAQDQSVTAGLAREVLEGQGPADKRRSSGFRTSGIVVSSAGGIRSHEKMVWDWPAPGDRVIEELR